jgi:hypothetical protein
MNWRRPTTDDRRVVGPIQGQSAPRRTRSRGRPGSSSTTRVHDRSHLRHGHARSACATFTGQIEPLIPGFSNAFNGNGAVDSDHAAAAEIVADCSTVRFAAYIPPDDIVITLPGPVARNRSSNSSVSRNGPTTWLATVRSMPANDTRRVEQSVQHRRDTVTTPPRHHREPDAGRPQHDRRCDETPMTVPAIRYASTP